MKLHRTALALAIAGGLALPIGARADVSLDAPADALAEASAGTVLGQVKEAARGVYLEGAVVSIDGRQTRTDGAGNFRITGLVPGNYTLSVDYLGYQRYSTQITVSEHSATRTDITLHASGASGEQLDRVVVRGQRDAQALALNQQRSSGNYINVVSADLLGQFPDNNIAESTQRIPGVSIERDQGEGRYVTVRGAPKEFTTVSIDGVQLANPDQASRGVELDTIPSDVISALEVTKALTPDMDGDAIAGNINIRTQSALDRDGMTLRASLGAGKFQLGDGDNQRAAATIGQRFGADGNIGVLVSASHSRQGRFTDNVETVYFQDGANGPILPETVEIKDYEGTRTRTGITGRLDFRLNEDNLLYFIASNSRFRDHEFRDNLVIDMDRHAAGSDDITGTVRATFDKELRERTYDKTIRTFNLGGEHWLGDWRADWQVSRSRAEKTTSPRNQFIFRSSVRPQMNYDYSDHDFPTWVIQGRDDAPASGVNLPEDWFGFRRLNERYEYGKESETGLRIDLKREQTWLGDDGDIKFGLRARLRDKSFDDERRRNSSAADFANLGISMSDMLCSDLGDSNNFGYFHAGRRFCRDIFSRHAGQLIASDNHKRLVADSITGDYTAGEDIHSAYARLDARWDALTMIAGLRYERTRISGEAAEFDEDSEEAITRSVGRSYGHLLPSLHLRHEFGPDSILRASYSTGLNRPNFMHTAPYRILGEREGNSDGTLVQDIAEGNPALKAAYAHNFDVSFEHYLRPLGLLSAALFYKRISDPLFVANSTVVDGNTRINLTRPENGGSGRVHGLELAWQQTFDQLPEPFDGFGVYANYTWAKSRAELPFDGGTTELPGTSRHNYNLALSYEKYGLNARLAYTYRSRFIQEFNIDNPDLNVFWDGRASVDLSASYRINRQWQVFAEVNNLTDTRQARFQGVRSRVLELEGFGRSWLAGVRFEY
ncbi:TonB-dependent receptor [Luteimonas sp. e5]